MTPKPSNYAIWPVLVPANATTELTVIACENVYLPRDGEEYILRINCMDCDISDYHALDHVTDVKAVAKAGAIKASFAFGAESLYWIDLMKEDKLLQSMQVYALEEDLYGLRPLKGDLHGHSHRSDGKRDPGALAGHYREQGYDFFVLTDHNRYYPSQEAQDAYKDVKLGLTILNGEEVHTPGSVTHIVHVGGKKSVAERYVKDPETYEKEVAELLPQAPADLNDHRKLMWARAEWATREIRKAEGLSIFAHPFWRPAHTYNVAPDLAARFLQSGMFDAYELVGGMKWDGINMSVNLWSEQRAKGLDIPVVGSSDVHELGIRFSTLFTIVWAKDNTREAILEAVRKGNSVAVEVAGQGADLEYRCYGSLRLVILAQFLLANYFPCTKRIAEGEGVMMRRYLIGAESGELLSACAGRVEAFWRKFTGIDPVATPSEKQLAFEEKWRQAQENGPKTKGSNLGYYGNMANKRQI